jgi:hypothetical protein
LGSACGTARSEENCHAEGTEKSLFASFSSEKEGA